jgi:hypothetical protein
MSKSMSYSVHPIAAALAKALEIIQSKTWTAKNENQKNLLTTVENISTTDFQTLAMQTIASYSAEEINDFLAQNGFDIKLSKLSGNEFGVASIMKILMTWMESSSRSIHGGDGTNYQGVKIKENIALFDSPFSLGYIGRITSKEGFDIYLTRITEKPENEEKLFTIAQQLMNSKNSMVAASLSSISFPEVNMDCKPDISWLIGMHAGQNIISQALMQTKFTLDKTGAKAEAAAAIGVRKCIVMSDTDLVMDQPFMAWIEKPGITVPVFVAWCDYDSWNQVTR